jgi:hypothetical protein
MKHLFQTLSLVALMMTLSSCDTYVEGHGHAYRHPAYRPGPSHSHTSHHYYSDRPARRSYGPSLNTNTNVGLGLRL